MKDERRQPVSRLLLVDHVAEGLGVSARTVRRKIAKGELVACRFGRLVRVHPDDLADYIDRQRGLWPREAVSRRLNRQQVNSRDYAMQYFNPNGQYAYSRNVAQVFPCRPVSCTVH